ncbi:MAG: hypothetical protein SPE59_11425 [Treponema sp.]|nr:hypothetical protein [Treponema sp.]
MVNKKLLKKSGVLFCLFIFMSCSLYSNTQLPYGISGEMTIEDSSIYELGGIYLKMYNKALKKISRFTVVFFLFDEEGNSPLLGRNNVVLNITSDIESEKMFEHCVSLDQFLSEVPEEPYLVDFLYVSEIVYEDGSCWRDPFGMYAF